MPTYQAKDKLKSGLPLGGLGTGKIEILPNGSFNAFSTQQNWSNPLMGTQNYPAILGYHFGLFAEKACLLQSQPILSIPTVKNIEFVASFPKAVLNYETRGLGVETRLEAFSNWFPGDSKNSCLPLVNFVVTIKNTTKKPLKMGFLCIARNLEGEWCVGRQNKISEDSENIYLEFLNKSQKIFDPKKSSMLVAFKKKGWKTTFLEAWNAVSKNFSFNESSIFLEAWDFFKKDGELPNLRNNAIAQSENQELCGALAASRVLKPGEVAELSFCFAWYAEGGPIGHRYEKNFKSAKAIAHYGLKHSSSFNQRANQIKKLVDELPFPEWFTDALLTNLAPFFSSSWFLKDGRFAFYEAPMICPLMGTLDVGYYGSIPLSFFFPDLEKSQLLQFARAQRPDGYIPHDLGRNRLDLPSNGTTFWHWKDLNPKFVLMAYRDFLWSGDKNFLRVIYPTVKKAMRWISRADLDEDGLPDHEGQDQTFDLWEFSGANAYTSGLYLAALLAAEKMAVLLGDKRFQSECRHLFRKARFSFEAKLWNGHFFGATSTLGQLNGQWYAHLLGLGYIADPQKIRQALKNTLRLNSSQSRYGMTNSVFRDGRPDLSNAHSRNIWGGMNYAFISLGILEGLPLSELLKEAKKIWDNVAYNQKSPWNQPDMADAKTGRFLFGDSYYRNMAIWAIPIAYAKKNKRTKLILNKLRALAKSR